MTENGVTLEVGPPIQSPQIATLIAKDEVSYIGISSEKTTKTFREITSLGSLSVPVTLTAHPNPLAPTGYQMVLQVLPLRVNTNPATKFFFSMQATSLAQSPVVSGTTRLLYYDLTYKGLPLKCWFGFTEGAFLSPTWDNIEILTSPTPTSDPSSITFTFTIGAEALSTLTEGVYWTNFTVALLPTPSTLSITRLRAEEAATFEYMEKGIERDLQQTAITPDTRTNLLASQAFIQAQVALLTTASAEN